MDRPAFTTVVIADTSIIIGLARIQHLHLLQKEFGRIIIPQAVFDELTNKNEKRAGATEVKLAPWIEVQPVSNLLEVDSFPAHINRGEAEAIVLATELNADHVLLDERAARTIAKNRGLPVIGTIGVLILAKKSGSVGEIAPLLDQLSATGFRLSEKLIQVALRLAGE